MRGATGDPSDIRHAELDAAVPVSGGKYERDRKRRQQRVHEDDKRYWHVPEDLASDSLIHP